MGIVKIKYILLLFLFNNLVYCQVIEIKKNDSIVLKRANSKNQYYLTVFNKENIGYNKINGFKYDTIQHIGTIIKCEKCKDESYNFLIEKNRNISAKKYKYFSSKNLFKNIKKYAFGGSSYFLIHGIYYKNLGMPIE